MWYWCGSIGFWTVWCTTAARTLSSKSKQFENAVDLSVFFFSLAVFFTVVDLVVVFLQVLHLRIFVVLPKWFQIVLRILQAYIHTCYFELSCKKSIFSFVNRYWCWAAFTARFCFTPVVFRILYSKVIVWQNSKVVSVALTLVRRNNVSLLVWNRANPWERLWILQIQASQQVFEKIFDC